MPARHHAPAGLRLHHVFDVVLFGLAQLSSLRTLCPSRERHFIPAVQWLVLLSCCCPTTAVQRSLRVWPDVPRRVQGCIMFYS